MGTAVERALMRIREIDTSTTHAQVISISRERDIHETAAATLASGFSKNDSDSSVSDAAALHPLERADASRSNQPHSILLSSIGVGISSYLAGTAQSVATEASRKALRDAIERGLMRFPTNQANLQVHIKLGVPGKPEAPSVPMEIDENSLTSILPPNIPVLPIEIVVGGLFVPKQESRSGLNASAVCTVVACITIQQEKAPRSHPPSAIGSPTSGAASAASTEGAGMVPSSWSEVEDQQQQSSSNANSSTQVGALPIVKARPLPTSVARNKSMEMLAQISAEIHERQPLLDDGRFDDRNGSSNYNYKKLPPGMTPKNNKRLFVKHSYRDHSHEVPQADEVDLLGPTSTIRSPNAAFPIKLHETLSLIESNGHDNIIGWLPHGRSFKIFNQKLFTETILPKYFVMTKKSSFLRQLNLYGFNRLSGTGPDQGSYYHEKFLRGMKFLCRRMQRQKVNGNGIRAAGNPDDEPDLSRFPVCPPMAPQHNASAALQLHLLQHQHQQHNNHHHHQSQHHQGQNFNHHQHPPATVQFANGSHNNHNHNHRDIQTSHSDESSSADSQSQSQLLRNGTGPQVSFPLKLQRILDKLEAEGRTDIISWLSHGRAFIVHDAERFVEELMPLYFNQTKYSSFQRQLHMYNFQRITAGQDKGAYHHPEFQRGKPHLSLRMLRTRVNGKGTRRPGNPEKEPNFHKMEPLPIISRGTHVEIPCDSVRDGDDSTTRSNEED